MLSLDKPGVSSCSSDEKPGAMRTRVAPARPATKIKTKKRTSASDNERSISSGPLHLKPLQHSDPADPAGDGVPVFVYTCGDRLRPAVVQDPCCRDKTQQSRN